MTLPHWALLPAGLHDFLPPDAEREAATVERLMAVIAGWGYERVKPPLLEFEETLLAGVGAAVAGQTFRLMDPISQRMMGVRADMTLQVARIAGSRLAQAPRPLRLSYAGQVLRVRGSELRPVRQFGQVGVELIGADAVAGDAEVAILAAAALQAVGVSHLSLDLTVPTLVPAMLDDAGLDAAARQDLRHALDRKDAERAVALAGPTGPALAQLLAAGGPADRAVARVADLDLNGPGRRELDRLLSVLAMVREALPSLDVTVDLVEHRGFEYHSGVSFCLFARGVRGELGRGGRYRSAVGGSAAEPATGMTLFLDSVMRAGPPAAMPARLYVPVGTPAAAAAGWRAEGWATVAGLAPAADEAAEARRLACSHRLSDGAVVPV